MVVVPSVTRSLLIVPFFLAAGCRAASPPAAPPAAPVQQNADAPPPEAPVVVEDDTPPFTLGIIDTVPGLERWQVFQDLAHKHTLRVVPVGADVPAGVDVLFVPLPCGMTQDDREPISTAIEAGVPAMLVVDPLPVFDPTLTPTRSQTTISCIGFLASRGVTGEGSLVLATPAGSVPGLDALDVAYASIAGPWSNQGDFSLLVVGAGGVRPFKPKEFLFDAELTIRGPQAFSVFDILPGDPPLSIEGPTGLESQKFGTNCTVGFSTTSGSANVIFLADLDALTDTVVLMAQEAGFDNREFLPRYLGALLDRAKASD